MENLIEIWSKICESNLFNFIVMILLLAWMVKKFDLGSKIEAGRKKIEQTISDSEQEKDSSLQKLYEAQEAVTKIDEEMFKIFKSAEDNAKIIGEKLIKEGHSQTGVIKENSKKAIDANIKSVKNEIMKETAEQALSLAEEKIKKALENDPELHHKYIYESIDAIDRIGVDL